MQRTTTSPLNHAKDFDVILQSLRNFCFLEYYGHFSDTHTRGRQGHQIHVLAVNLVLKDGCGKVKDGCGEVMDRCEEVQDGGAEVKDGCGEVKDRWRGDRWMCRGERWMMQRWNMYDASAKDGCGEVKCGWMWEAKDECREVKDG